MTLMTLTLMTGFMNTCTYIKGSLLVMSKLPLQLLIAFDVEKM